MTTIDLTVHKDRRKRAIQRAREKNIIIPTYAQMKDPAKIPAKVKEELAKIGPVGCRTRATCSASPGTTSPRPAAAASAASTTSNCPTA